MRKHVDFGVGGGEQKADCYGKPIIPADISLPAIVLFKMYCRMNRAHGYTPAVKILYARTPHYKAR